MRQLIILYILFSLAPGWAQSSRQSEAGSDPSSEASLLAEAGSGSGDYQSPSSGLQVLTLEEAVRMAFANNPDVPQTIHRIEQAQAGIRAARSAFLPMMGFESKVQRMDWPHMTWAYGIDQRKFDPTGVDFNRPGVLNSNDIGLKMKYQLFNGGADVATLGMAKRQLNLARLGQQRVRNELIASIANTFQDITIADELAEAEQVSIKSITAQVKEAEARLRAGAVLREDVLSLQVGLAAAEDALIGAQNAGRLSRTMLACLLGADVGALANYEFAEISPPSVPEDFEAGLALARKQNPDYKSAQEEVEKAQLGVKVARAASLPTLDLYGQYFMIDNGAEFELDRLDWIVTAKLSFCLFDGFRRRSDRAKAKAAVKVGEMAQQRAGLNVETGVRFAYIRLEGARSRLKVATAAVENAEATLNLVTQRYRAGAVTVTRFLESERARTFARVSVIQARIREMQALIEVARVIGWWTEGKLETQ
jgi:outer membrane protein